ncbi:E3 ubiquitin-protein ligase RNFT1 [Chanos chanos]|uniref:E3 ubiquitin-protein ligase RNFT1 n=1 Tax=Chanos chanos TaxID=29144 RepID=A0A6J2WX30_CHACN|nr:E3 ubiquitin-protein ligase RNFT1 [Chanos chanos]
MKLRSQYERRDSNEYRRTLKLRESPTVMQPEGSSQGGNGLTLNLQPELLVRTPGAGSINPPEAGETRVHISSPAGESGGRSASRRPRAHSHTHSHSHGHTHSHEPEPDPRDADQESGEPSTSFSELRYIFHWVQKSLPFLAILCAKVVIQHALGLAVGVGLFTTFLYVNKNIRTQVFLQGRASRLQCVWLLLFLTFSTLLLYYTFREEMLYYCLIFVNHSAEPLGFWDVLWAVGVTNYVVKFLFMGLKCLILLLPSSLMAYRTRGQWYMLTEEVGQVYQVIAPVPCWFRYLVTYQEMDGFPGITLGILLALLYLILKLLGLYGQWSSLQKTMRVFLSAEHNGAPATKAQCSEAGDVCSICQADFREPRVLLCQHIFCEECIALWLNQEKTCPLCRTVITDKVHRWKDGSTSPYLQVY